MRCLIVEDSQRLQKYLAKGLRQAGYAVDTASDGNEALSLLHGSDYDLVVLDLMLPGIDGLTLLQRMKEDGIAAGVLILSARDTVPDRVRGLSLGADDYLVKPFALDELLARVQALVRRKYDTNSTQITVGDLTIDLNQRRALTGGSAITLKPRDYAVLEYLALRHGQVVSRREIEYHIYEMKERPSSNSVESAVSSLRKAIDTPGRPSLIETRRGLGYVLREPEA